MDCFNADQSGDAPYVGKSQDQEDGYFGTDIHIQPADKEGRKDAKGPVADRRHHRMRVGETGHNIWIEAVALRWITRSRPEERDWLALSENLCRERDTEKARKDHDTPNDADMNFFGS